MSSQRHDGKRFLGHRFSFGEESCVIKNISNATKEINETHERDNERHEEANGITGTSNESPLSRPASEKLSDDQEEDKESRIVFTTPSRGAGLGTSTTKLSPPNREKKTPPVLEPPIAVDLRTLTLENSFHLPIAFACGQHGVKFGRHPQKSGFL